MTNETEQLRRMVEARERATKGPWYAYEGKVRLESQLDGPEIASTWGQTDATKSWGGANEISDACFIALSGTLDLLAILTRMEKMEAALKWYADVGSLAALQADVRTYNDNGYYKVGGQRAREAIENE